METCIQFDSNETIINHQMNAKTSPDFLAQTNAIYRKPSDLEKYTGILCHFFLQVSHLSGEKKRMAESLRSVKLGAIEKKEFIASLSNVCFGIYLFSSFPFMYSISQSSALVYL